MMLIWAYILKTEIALVYRPISVSSMTEYQLLYYLFPTPDALDTEYIPL